MSKATCSKCGFAVLLEGKERWTIKEAIKYLIDKQKNHKCEVKNKLGILANLQND